MKVIQGFLVFVIVAALLAVAAWFYLGKPELVLKQSATSSPMQLSIEKLTDDQTQLLTRISQLEAQVQQMPQLFTLPEAYYYLNIANLHLTVFHDVPTALKLMQWVQQRFSLTQTPLPLQEAINADLLALQGVALVNTTEITQQISNIETQLTTLPLRKKQASEPVVTPNAVAQSDWQQALNNTWAELKNLIRIQPRNTSIDYVLFDETILRQTVRVELERASIAAVLNQTDLYQASLQQAILALQQFFDVTDVTVQQALAQLETLSKQQLVPEIPVADRALMWLQTHTV